MNKVVLIVLFLCPALVYAEEPIAGEGKIKTSVSIGYVQTSGNSDTKALSLKANRVYDMPSYKVSLNLKTLYAESGGKNDTEKIDFKGRYELRRDRFFPFLDFKFYRNPFQKYEYRIAAGPGVGYYIFRTDKQYLTASYYLYYNSDRLIDADTKYRNYSIHHLEERFRHKFSDNLKFKQKVVWSLTDRKDEDYFIDFEAQLVNKITQTYKIEISYAANYQNKPVVASVEKLDTTIMTSLLIEF